MVEDQKVENPNRQLFDAVRENDVRQAWQHVAKGGADPDAPLEKREFTCTDNEDHDEDGDQRPIHIVSCHPPPACCLCYSATMP